MPNNNNKTCHLSYFHVEEFLQSGNYFLDNLYFRTRKTIKHKIMDTRYRFPTPEMLDHIRDLGCNLFPVGYPIFSKKDKKEKKKTDFSIEWEVAFTKAEQYMTRNLHHPKVRVYLFSLLMLKCHFGKLI